MIKLDDKKLNSISGGALSKGILLAVATVGIFIIGVVDGYIRPLKCNK